MKLVPCHIDSFSAERSTRLVRASLLLVAIFLCGFVSSSDKSLSAADVPSAGKAQAIKVNAGDWPWWRGPHGNGIAEPNRPVPLSWSNSKNVLWKAPIPGRGHSSPIIVGHRVVLTTAEEDREIQSVLCFDRQTGKPLWRTDVHRGGMDRKGNKKTTQASSTAACDGQRFIVNFLNSGAVFTTALDLDGKQIWQTKVSDFATHQGFGSSPALFGPYAFVTTDSRGGGVVAALNRESGKIVWSSNRPQKANYASAAIVHAAGRDQVVVHGCDLVTSFDPLTGNKLWETEGATTECVTTLVTDGQHVFTSGGWPRTYVQAVLADGSKKTAWENNIKVYVPSMIVHKGSLFAIQDSGVATCWNCQTGAELWKERLGGNFSASLVMADEKMFATNEAGQTFIFNANPARFESIGMNQLGDEVYATPAICGGRIFMRVVENANSQRQEMLYCVGEK